MSSLPLPGLDAPQTRPEFGAVVSSRIVELYENQPFVAFSREGEQESAGLIPHCSIDFQQNPYRQRPLNGDARPMREQLMKLQSDYTFVSDDSLIADVLRNVPVLYSLLKDAVQPLRLTFGERKLLQLEAVKSDEDTTLRVMVKLPSDTKQPAEQMRKFKRNWWLKNCSRSEASLVFDYETGNGF